MLKKFFRDNLLKKFLNLTQNSEFQASFEIRESLLTLLDKELVGANACQRSYLFLPLCASVRHYTLQQVTQQIMNLLIYQPICYSELHQQNCVYMKLNPDYILYFSCVIDGGNQ